jgi:hypothetical protein
MPKLGSGPLGVDRDRDQVPQTPASTIAERLIVGRLLLSTDGTWIGRHPQFSPCRQVLRDPADSGTPAGKPSRCETTAEIDRMSE